MTIKDRFLSMFSGWGLTFKKLSVQIEGVQLIAVLPVLFAGVQAGQISGQNVLLIMGVLSFAKFLASNMSQDNIGTYDKATQTVVDKVQ